MSLCQVCQDIDFAAFTAHAQRASVGRPHHIHIPSEGFPTGHDLFYVDVKHCKRMECNKDPSIFIPHHKTVDALKSSARNCPLCELIAVSFEATLHEMRLANEKGFGYTLPDSECEFYICRRMLADGLQVVGRVPPDSPELKGESKIQYPGTRYDLIAGIGFCVSDDDILADFITGRTVPPSPVSSHVVERMKTWLASLSPQSRPLGKADTKLPSRLLAISSDGHEVALQDPREGTMGKYVALSHCWGSSQPLTLTRMTAQHLRAGVKRDTLSQTIQDAIWLVHELGYRFLWVDTLCIFQDDAQDWAKESARMTEVYGGATLTIAADRAASCDEGFLSDRPLRKLVPVPIKIGGRIGKVLAFSLPKKYAGDTRRCVFLETEPLSKRGWALQERYLSPCMLHFGREQIFFETYDSFVPEDVCSSQPCSFLERQRTFHIWMLLDHHASEQMESKLKRAWFGIVGHYSRRKLTMPNDKLPALAGLAKLFAREFTKASRLLNDSGVYSNAFYLAGLWSSSLADLCWELDWHSVSGVRPSEYRAPSWSWASIDGDINYSHGDHLLFDPKLAIATVQDGGVDLCTAEAPFGKVKGGWIRLRSMLLQLTEDIRRPRGYDGLELCGFVLWQEGFSTSLYPPKWDAEAYRKGHIRDIVRPTNQTTELWAIPLTWYTADRDRGLISGPLFLLVKAAEHSIPAFRGIQAFRRVGTIYGNLNVPVGPGKTQLKRDILEEKWAVAKSNGGFEDILLI